MKENKENMNNELDLVLRTGMWENIEPHIPIYKQKNNKKMFLMSFFLIIGIFTYYKLIYINKKTYTNNLTKLEKNGSKLNIKTTEDKLTETNLNGTKNLIETNNNSLEINQSNNNKGKLEQTFIENNKIVNLQQIIKNHDTIPFNKTKLSRKNLNLLSVFNEKQILLSNLKEEESSVLSGLKLIKSGLLPLYINFKTDKQENISKNKTPNLPSNKKSHKYIELVYSNFQSRFILSPELMALDNGKGQGLQFNIGKTYKLINIYTGFNYQDILQKTIMPGKYSTKYHQVFQPNFKTSLPGDYAYRVHDTNSLAIPGKSNNFINQNFKLLGIHIGLNAYFLNIKKFRIGAGYSFRYQLLKKANTFFWDSVNSVAVRFYENDKNIVFRNIFSSQINIDLGYKIDKNMSFHALPFFELEHNAIIKHYYKLKIQNFGLNLALRYQFN